MSRDEIKRFVEAPLVTAAEELYDKNIRTLESSANAVNLADAPFIVVDYETLSPENKAISREVGEVFDYEGTEAVDLIIPFDRDNPTVSSIQANAEAIVHRFQGQPLTWAPGLDLAEIKQLYGIGEEENYQPKDFSDFYYDPQSQRFYPSEEIFRKMKEFS